MKTKIKKLHPGSRLIEYRSFVVKNSGAGINLQVWQAPDGSLSYWDGYNFYEESCFDTFKDFDRDRN